MALAELKAAQATKAIPHIDVLLKKKPEHILYRLLQADAQFELGQTDESFSNYQSILKIYPYSYPTTIEYARHLLALHKAQQAYDLLQQYSRNREANSNMLKLLSEAASETNRKAEAYLYLAEYHFLNGNTRTAIEHLRTASKYQDNDYYLASKIEAKMKTYEQIAIQEK
jgi:predicted Zn-dependent protease